MVGLIPKILIDLVRATGGDAAMNRVKASVGMSPEQEFKLNVVYSDADWARLVSTACEVLGITLEQAEDAFADYFLKDALTRWPMWFTLSKNSREFLLRQPAIHNSLAAGVIQEQQRSAVADKFRIEETPDTIVTHYRSPNRHCGLYKALARGIIQHYGDTATIEERLCAKQGADECQIHIHWTNLRARP